MCLSAIVKMRQAYLVNTDLVEHVLAFDQFPRLLFCLEVTETHQAACITRKLDGFFALNFLRYETGDIAYDPE